MRTDEERVKVLTKKGPTFEEMDDLFSALATLEAPLWVIICATQHLVNNHLFNMEDGDVRTQILGGPGFTLLTKNYLEKLREV